MSRNLNPNLDEGPLVVEWKIFNTVHDFSRNMDDFVRRTSDAPFIGVDIRLSVDGTADAVAFSANDFVAVVVTNSTESAKKRRVSAQSSNDPLRSLLLGHIKQLAGFEMYRLAMHIKNTFGLDIKAFDITSFISGAEFSSPGEILKDAFDQEDLHELNALWYEHPQEHNFDFLIRRAWFASKILEKEEVLIASSSELDTAILCDKVFQCLYKMLAEVERIDAAKARQVQGEFSHVTYSKEGNIVITNERYKTRIRASKTTKIVMQVQHVNEFQIGRAIGLDGKRTSISLSKSVDVGKITKLKVVGKEERTISEKARDFFLLLLLQGKQLLNYPDFPLIKHLWFPDNTTQAVVQKQSVSGQTAFSGERLNDSQVAVVDAMVNSSSRFIIIHGPPGTGKTSTISAAVKRWARSSNSTAWLVAQSNVGVKNIAERLCKDDIRFVLIVSKEFYYEWHEHIYEGKIRAQTVRADRLRPRSFRGVRVVLCTLSMLSNPILKKMRVFELVPMKNLVVDEASQIGIFNYLHLFGRFKTLAKVCFSGDPKQLPPYGQEEAKTMESIFDVEHLKPHAYFLDTQYRMPEPLGHFISEAVYDSKLKSSHPSRSPSCVAFVDVEFGKEQRKGFSYKNSREVQTIIRLVRSYYSGSNYCIITPYDAQRGRLEDELKREGLRWDNVYNVDSFQGNEADYILISIVRTEAPGFLKSTQRVNVMLTRCKKGMVIVCDREFMHRRKVQRKTILGKLCHHWETNYGVNETWRSWQEVEEVRATLPGTDGDHFGGVCGDPSQLEAGQSTPSAKSLSGEGRASKQSQKTKEKTEEVSKKTKKRGVRNRVKVDGNTA